MACSSFLCINVSLSSTRENFGVSVAKTQLQRYRQLNGFSKSQSGLFWDVRCSSVISGKSKVPFFGFYDNQKYQHRLCCVSQIRALSNENSGDKTSHLGNRRQNGSVRKRSPLRLRPRLRLLMRRMRRVSVSAMLNDFVLFLRKTIKSVAIIVSFSVACGLCIMFLAAVPHPKVVPYSELVTSLQNGSVNHVLIIEGCRRIYYNTNGQDVENHEVSVENVAESNLPSENLRTMRLPRALTPEWQYVTRKIFNDEKFFYSLMREKGTTYSSAPPSAFVALRNILITLLSLWIPLSPMMWFLYRHLSAGNSLAKKRKSNDHMVSFDDVEGVDAAKVELMEIVSCLQGAINYKKLGAKLPRGVLLVGPPGTGKTLLARAVAGEAGVPFFSCSASEFVEMFVGRGAARVRDLFNSARKHAPSIIFIDELDSVGGKRGRSSNDERDQTLNQLLTEMDGFESEMKVVVIAATNIPESLDPALCRPGRFSRKVLVGEPDEEGRRKILAVYLRKVPLEENIELICDLVANLTPGFVGADLANIVNEAALLAARRDSETVTREDIMEAVERAKFGINTRQLKPGILGQEIGRLFPWMTSITGRNATRNEGLQGILGYQA